MKNLTPRQQFLEKFHGLISHYDRIHEENEYNHSRVEVKPFYENFIKRYDEVIGQVRGERIRAILLNLREKAAALATFNVRERLHDLAESIVNRLKRLGVELYSLPDREYLLDTTEKLEVTVLLNCCNAFVKYNGLTGDCEHLRCEGTTKSLSIEPGGDLQHAVRVYYEQYCRECERLPFIEEQVRKRGPSGRLNQSRS